MSEINLQPFPKGALIAVGALLGLTLTSTAAVRIARSSAPADLGAARLAMAASVDLRFSDQANGSIQVREAGSGRLVATLASNTNGFIRGVLRGLAHDRLSRHIGEVPPFRVSQDRAGKLWLQDTATGRLIDLEAFGVSNRASFLALLQGREPDA